MQKFKVLDPKLFVQKSFNECEEALSELADMYESDTDKEDLLSEFKSFSPTSRCCKMLSLKKFIKTDFTFLRNSL